MQPSPETAPPPLVRLESVTKFFPNGATALDGISLDVPGGQVLAIVGPSGAGKSTLLRTVNLLERPSQGRVIVAGQDLTALNEPELRRVRRSIGMIFQHFNLLANRTAAQNVALALELAGWPAGRIRARVPELLDLVGLSGKGDRYPAQLSGGQKQRVGIARALAAEPRVLLCDEATSALDPETTSQILDLIRQINGRLNLTVLLVTHEMSVVRQVADRVAVLEAGRLVEEGPVARIFTHPTHKTTARFLAGETGALLPPELTDRLLPAAPAGGGNLVIRLAVAGTAAEQPLLTRAAARAGVDAVLLAGRVEPVQGHPFAAFIVELSGPLPAQDGAVALLRAAGADVEILGHVATALRAAG